LATEGEHKTVRKVDMNTPEKIVDRSAGARFYCAACEGTYARYPHTRQCKCRVYVSADTLKGGKSLTANRGTEASGRE
jgi:hypothetical protein